MAISTEDWAEATLGTILMVLATQNPGENSEGIFNALNTLVKAAPVDLTLRAIASSVSVVAQIETERATESALNPDFKEN